MHLPVAFRFTWPLILYPAGAQAATSSSQQQGWFLMSVGLLGGLAFFLYGMEKMSSGLKQSAGDQMRSILAALTKNTIIGMLAGAFVTMVIQSSSATMVMVISFVQSQLMSFAQSLGIILGANIGTTVTAQMVAFKLTDVALVMVIIGFALHMFGNNQKVKSIGSILLGFGMLFYGMKMMSDAMKPLRSSQEFIALMQGLEKPLLGLLVGMLFTALVQSSSAAIGVVIVLAQQNLITLTAGIALILGANIGTCITAVLAAIGTAREAKRVALAYVIIEVIGVALFLVFLDPFIHSVHAISHFSGSGIAREIANAHTIFNVTIGILFLPLVGVVVKLCERFIPDQEVEPGLIPTTWHLDESVLSTPSLAIELVRAEISRMAKILFRMHQAAIYPFISSKPRRDTIHPQLTLLEGIEMREHKINFLNRKTRDYILKIHGMELTPEQATETMNLISLLDAMEGIGDTITKQIVPLIDKKQKLNADFSKEGKRELVTYHRKVGHQLLRLQEVMTTLAESVANKVVQRKNRYMELDATYRRAHLDRLITQCEQTLETHSVHVELMDAIKVINWYTAEIADLLVNSGILVTGETTKVGDDNKELEQHMEEEVALPEK